MNFNANKAKWAMFYISIALLLICLSPTLPGTYIHLVTAAVLMGLGIFQLRRSK